MFSGSMVKEPTTEVKLADAELLVLDGQCSPLVQAEVDAAKERAAMARRHAVAPEFIHFASRILRAARKQGLVVRRGFGLRHCTCCGTSGGYAARRRTTSAGRKGEPDSSKPLSLSGTEYIAYAITIQGYSQTAACSACRTTVEPILVAELATLEVQVPDELAAPGRPRLQRFDLCKCECGWSGHDGEMRQLRTLLGDGYYPAGCPRCERVNTPFGPRPISRDGGFVVLPPLTDDQVRDRRAK